MDKETPKNKGQKEKIETEEWEIVEGSNSEKVDVTAKEPSTRATSTAPPQKTVIEKPKKDRNKCPKCGSEQIMYFEQEDFYWCQSCHEAYQFEQED